MARRRTRLAAPPRIAVVGFSGAGKTTLLERLLPALLRRGLSVAVVKHTWHAHDFDRPGKDSARLKAAGARAVFLAGPGSAAWFGPPPPKAVIDRMLGPVDLILVEGGKELPVPKIEVHRRALGKPLLCGSDLRVFAVVTDARPRRKLPRFSSDDVEPLADLVVARLSARRRRAAHSA
jgi:molybdopterin-guanine dinucleotide biosynthesis adapter protein